MSRPKKVDSKHSGLFLQAYAIRLLKKLQDDCTEDLTLKISLNIEGFKRVILFLLCAELPSIQIGIRKSKANNVSIASLIIVNYRLIIQ